ncbi:DciA family protein [Streptomyces sp. NPDC000941]
MTAELSGVDLARQALIAAREAAQKNGGRRQEKPKRSRTRAVRRDGREPLGLATAISLMMTERGMVAPAAGGSVLAKWADILAAAAPELAGHIKAVKFDADTGRLDVVPDAPAYGAKLRWSSPKLITAANEQVKGAGVRTLHILPPAPGTADPASEAAAPTRQPAAPAGPVKTREMAPDGYRQALAAHQASRPERVLDPRIAAAIERQNASRGMREPEEAFGDGQAAIEELQTAAARDAAAGSGRARALRRARAERAGSGAAPAVRKARIA